MPDTENKGTGSKPCINTVCFASTVCNSASLAIARASVKRNPAYIYSKIRRTDGQTAWLAVRSFHVAKSINEPSLNAGIDEMKIYSAWAISLQSSSVRLRGGTISFFTSSEMVICCCCSLQDDCAAKLREWAVYIITMIISMPLNCIHKT